MRIVIKEIEVYNYNELTDDAKNKAMSDYISALVDIMPFESLSHDSNFYKAYEKAMEMKTPWFIGEYIHEYCKEEMERDLINEFEFLEDGTTFYNV